MADLVDQHVADDMAQRLVMLGPVIQDRPAVEPDHVGQPGDVVVAAERQSDVLKQAGEPLHRDEIVKRVLKSRFVKETTILLNLQGKPQFKRVAKATYTLEDAE